MVRRISDYDELEPVEEEVVGKEEKKEKNEEGVKEVKEEKGEKGEKPAAASGIPDFAEVVATPVFEGERRRIEEILGKPLVIKDFVELPSRFRPGEPFVVVQAEDENGETFTFASGSQVLIKQLRMMREASAVPFRAKITRIKRYYTFTSAKA